MVLLPSSEPRRETLVTDRDSIGEYLADLNAELGPHRLRRRLTGEAEAHLREAVASRIRAGVSPDCAASEAIASFGGPDEVAATLKRQVPARLWPLVAAAGSAAMAGLVLGLAMRTSDAPDRPAVQDSAALHGPADSVRVARALDLSARASEILAAAHVRGHRASACLRRHGGRTGVGGGIIDPSGRARAACRRLVEANEKYLDSRAFRQVLAEAQPRFEAAERCAAEANRAPDGAVRVPGVSAGLKRSAAQACHRDDGLPSPSI